MDKHQVAWNQRIVELLITNLEKRRMEASYAPTAEQAKQEILQMIPEGSVVYRTGSMTATYMGLWDEIPKIAGVEVIDPYNQGKTPEEGIELRRKGMMADIMVTGCNAVTMDGELVNLDGTGNRVAAMIFGPKKVILAVGMNKVVPDLETAMIRVKHYAAPVNVMRLKFKNPCLEDGQCHDCSSPKRICNMWGIIEGHSIKDRIHVKLIGENLGY